MKLSDLLPGQKGIIIKVRGKGNFRRRIMEMGFVCGQEILSITKAPLQDPTEYKVMGYEVSLRKKEAELIEIFTQEEMSTYCPMMKGNDSLVVDANYWRKVAKEQSRVINVSLIGNPNSGKTSLFNVISSNHERVGNYGGVTVEAKECNLQYKEYTFHLTDLPGTYSLSIYSPEEIYVRNHILESLPDVIINVVSTSGLERNLYLTTQLIDMDAIVVIALNMYDELEKSGDQFDYEQLAKMIGCPIVPTVARIGKGIQVLLDQVIEVYERKNPIVRPIYIHYGTEIEVAIRQIVQTIHEKDLSILNISCRYLSLCLLEYDKSTEERIKKSPFAKEILSIRNHYAHIIERDFKEDIETILTNARYGFIRGALKETYRKSKIHKQQLTPYIDKIVMHKFWSYPIFLLLMFCIFQCTFSLGKCPMKWIEWMIQKISEWINSSMGNGLLKDLLTNGIIGGVGSVIIFLPNIVILYLFISLLEDTGYMARAAFIMDKPMHKMGLHGKSFIPLIMGFGCNVPAIMSTRIIESKNTRLITMLITPFMSCSARLPIYILLIGAFFPNNGGLVLVSLYSVGILFAIGGSLLLKKFLIKGEDLPFVMELPPYRLPTQKSVIHHIWDKTAQYVRKMGGLILLATVLVWFLEYFPQNEKRNQYYEQKIAQLSLKNRSEKRLSELRKQQSEEQKRNSFIGHIGQWIEPLVKPLGFDWKISSCLIFGMSAKELIVSTMGILYTHAENNDGYLLQKQLKKETGANGKPMFSSAKALSLLIFILLYFPCIATLTTIKNESGTWKWALFCVFYTTSIAWILSFTIYQIGSSSIVLFH